LTLIAVATQVLVVAAVLLPAFALLALRRRQIAVLRALGAPRSYVFGAVWGLITALTACGAAIGLGLGWLGALAFARIVEARTGLTLPVSLGAGEALMALAVALAGALLALLPTAATWRAPIAEGLRA